MIGYPAARVWGCPTTAMWTYRVGAQNAKRMLLTGDSINGKEAEKMGLVVKALPQKELDEEVEKIANRMATVPINQLAMQKMIINKAAEGAGLEQVQQLAITFDGIARHSPEGHNFKKRVEKIGWKKTVKERDNGTFDWTTNKPIKKSK